MSRYIDADAVMEVLERSAKDPRNETAMTSWANAFQELIDLLDDTLIPIATADVVEVTRCKDCMHSEIDKYAPAECQNRCKLSQLYHEPTFFCKCGEPRTDLLEWIHRGDDDEQGV